VRIPEGFWLGEVPVTQALYEAVMGQNPSHFQGEPKNPVDRVSWFVGRHPIAP
jgi:formylglycine-generating enzyme required for sulfatase activity